MGRTTPATNIMEQYGPQANQAYNSAQNNVGQYTANMNKLDSGVNVGANPYTSAGYLSNVNKLQSESLNTAAGTAKGQLQRRLRASGGLNGSQDAMATRDVGLETGRLADTLTAQRAAKDYQSNLGWQQYLAGAPLAAANTETGLYGDASKAQIGALDAYSQMQGQRYGFWGGMIDSAIKSGGQMGAAGIAACWIAAELFGGWMEPRTVLIREWLNGPFSEHWYGRVVMNLYRRFGEGAARAIHRFPSLGSLFRPLFEIALEKAQAQEVG